MMTLVGLTILLLAALVSAWAWASSRKPLPEEAAENQEERAAPSQARQASTVPVEPFVPSGQLELLLAPFVPTEAEPTPKIVEPPPQPEEEPSSTELVRWRPSPLLLPATAHPKARGRSAALVRRRHWPIVLAHGVLGFDELGVAGARTHYFRGTANALRRKGTPVHLLKVPPLASIPVRAAHLAEQVRALGVEKVNIIAHSMGGLDARYAITHLGLAPLVASLTTIGTPHHGTPIADHGLSIFADKLGLRPLLGALSAEAFDDLTTAQMARFNEGVTNRDSVRYGCYPASVNKLQDVNMLLSAPYLFLRSQAIDNDGIVPEDSQVWGDVMGYIHADHWAQIGWSGEFDAREFYCRVVKDLRSQGL